MFPLLLVHGSTWDRDTGRQGGGGSVAGNIRKAARSFSKVAALRPMRAYARLSRVSTVDRIHTVSCCARARMCVLQCVGKPGRNRRSRPVSYITLCGRGASKSWQATFPA